MVTVTLYHNILLISQFRSFFSLFSICKTTQTFALPHHLLLPLIHINTPTQTNQHRDAQKHTNKSTERECTILNLILLWIGAGGGDRCLWVDGNGFWCLWIGVGNGDWCLWVDRGRCFLWRNNVTMRERGLWWTSNLTERERLVVGEREREREREREIRTKDKDKIIIIN